MYQCRLCGETFQTLILEFNTLVCEGCSISKNVTNWKEFDKGLSTEKREGVIIGPGDYQNLICAIMQIENKDIREDFLDAANEYVS